MARSGSCLHACGPKVGIIYLLGAPGIVPSVEFRVPVSWALGPDPDPQEAMAHMNDVTLRFKDGNLPVCSAFLRPSGLDQNEGHPAPKRLS